MKDGSHAAAAGPDASPGGLVLIRLGCGPGERQEGLASLAQVTDRLAGILRRDVRQLSALQAPDMALSELNRPADGGGGWLAALEQDVGLSLEEGRCWADVLGAWRQPALLVIPAAQLASGLPAAGTALLRQRRVPLVGLLQWGGTWQEQKRRRDALPWLGLLTAQPCDGDDEVRLTASLLQRWRQLDLA